MAYIGKGLGANTNRKRYIYTGTAAQTTFTGSDDNSITLAYIDTVYMDVYQNGVLLVPATDYAATTGTSVVLEQGASVGDTVEIVVYDVFSVSDTVSQSSGGSFRGSITFAGDIIKDTAGTSNFAAGLNAGNSIASGGIQNTVIGDEAGTALTTGDYNVALGYQALKTEDGHGGNVAIGRKALEDLNAGQNSYNTAVGYNAGRDVTTGTVNTLIGAAAGTAITTGAYNTFVGNDAGTATTDSEVNVAVGNSALQTNTTGDNNTAIGGNALYSSTTASNNTAVGHNCLDANTEGHSNVAVGKDALGTNVDGDANTAVGFEALATMEPANGDSSNVAVGYKAGKATTTGVRNTFIGAHAAIDHTIANDCVAVGRMALFENTEGSSLVAVGMNAMLDNTTGVQNVGIGESALSNNTTASTNVAVGHNSMLDNTTGANNTAVGTLSLANNTTAAANTAFGYKALEDATEGHSNVACGAYAISNVTDGDKNVALGFSAGAGITTGGANICIGNEAGFDTTNLVSGSANILIGDECRTSATDSGSQIVMGTSVTSAGANNFTFGAGATDSNIAFGGTSVSAPSDVRLKEDIQDATVGLGFINDLRPVTFQWKQEQDVPEEMNAYVAGSTKRVMNEKHNHGFIAQEVKTVIDNHDIKDGFDMWTEDESDGRQRLGDASLMPIMVKAMQELSTKLDAALSRIATLEG